MRFWNWLVSMRVRLVAAAATIAIAAGIWMADLDGHWWRSVKAVTFSPDGKTLAACLYGGQTLNRDFHWFDANLSQTVHLFDAESGTHDQTLDHVYSRGWRGLLYSWGQSLAYSPDGRTLAIGYWDGTVKLWDTEDKKLSDVLTSGMPHVCAVAYSRNGRILAASYKIWITTWEMAADNRETRLESRNSISSLAVSPNGSLLAVGDGVWDRGAEIWELDKPDVKQLAPGTPFEGLAVQFSPDGQLLAVGGPKSTILWNIQDGAVRWDLATAGTRSVAFSPDGATLVTGGESGLRFWDVNSSQPVGEIRSSQRIRSVAYSPDGRRVATGNSAGELAVWDAETKEQLWTVHVSKPWDVNWWLTTGLLTGLTLFSLAWIVAHRARRNSLVTLP